MTDRPIERLLRAAALIVAAHMVAATASADTRTGRDGVPALACAGLLDGSGGRIVTAFSGRPVGSASGSDCAALRPAVERIGVGDAALRRATRGRAPIRLTGSAAAPAPDAILRVSTAPVAVVAMPALAAAIIPAAPLAAPLQTVQARSPVALAVLVAGTAILLVFLMRRSPALREALPAARQGEVLSILATRWQPGDGDGGAAADSLSGLARAFDLLEEAIVVIDRQQRIQLVNDAFVQLAGASAQALLGSNLSAIPWLGAGFSTDASGHPWRRALDAAHSWDIESRPFAPPQGTPVSLTIRCTPVLDANDRVHGCIVAFHQAEPPADLAGSDQAAEAA